MEPVWPADMMLNKNNPTDKPIETRTVNDMEC